VNPGPSFGACCTAQTNRNPSLMSTAPASYQTTGLYSLQSNQTISWGACGCSQGRKKCIWGNQCLQPTSTKFTCCLQHADSQLFRAVLLPIATVSSASLCSADASQLVSEDIYSDISKGGSACYVPLRELARAHGFQRPTAPQEYLLLILPKRYTLSNRSIHHGFGDCATSRGERQEPPDSQGHSL